MRKCFFILFLLCFVVISFAQSSHFVSSSFTPGFLLAHRADIKNLAAHNVGFELSYEADRANTPWGKYYKTPSIGVGLLYYNFGQEISGHAWGALTHVKMGLWQNSKVDLRFRMGAGIAYLTRKFDPVDNRRNQAIGSHLNGTMQFGLVSHIKLAKKDYLELGLSITHYSNAAFKVPNLGYNIPSITARYGLRVGQTKKVEDNSADYQKWSYRATAIYGKKQRNFANPVDFCNVGLQLRALRSQSLVGAWRMGLDYTADKTYKYAEDPSNVPDYISIVDQSEVALAGGYQWSFGKLDVIAEGGLYIYKPAQLKNPLSQRLGLAYRMTEHLSTQGTLRFHRGVADFFEIGIGYTL